jgi:hypothetical protein
VALSVGHARDHVAGVLQELLLGHGRFRCELRSV